CEHLTQLIYEFGEPCAAAHSQELELVTQLIYEFGEPLLSLSGRQAAHSQELELVTQLIYEFTGVI
ncbi:hypothetical protein, partial [Streptococcus pneumoniae]|uniref:hypothetical protein n=1 Tax=Streptococcus pneumoniae TaxID=1313 RepID=UPI001E6273B5